MKTIKDFSAHSATGQGGVSVRRAAMMLAVMLLTTMTAWADAWMDTDGMDADFSMRSMTETKELATGWNWFSTRSDITMDDLKAALVEALPRTNITIQSKSQSTKYNGNNGRWTGQLSLDVAQMYMIQASSDCEITLQGDPIDPVEHPVTIAEGDNWIGFPFAQSMSVANAFAGFAVNGDVIISQTASACYTNGAWKGTLKILKPGQGYIYKSAASGERTFVYPAGGGADGGSNDSFNGDSHWQDFNYHEFMYNRPVVAAIKIDGQYVTADDYDQDDMEVAAFAGGVCRGNRFTLTNRYVVNGGEPYPVLDGMPVYYDTSGEEVSFQLYANDIEYTDCEILYDGDPLTILTGEDYVQGWMVPEKPIILSFTSPAVDLELSDTGANANAIVENNNRRANVTLQGRTLYKDGSWNTLCLPFNVEIAGSVLDDDGVDVRMLSSSDFSGGTLTLNFTPISPSGEQEGLLVAGKPYIIKWSKPDGYDGHEEDFDITDPVFTNVVIPTCYTTAEAITAALAASCSPTTYVDFIGTYSPEGIYTADKTKLYLGADNTLYYPTATDFLLNSFRGYFQLKNGLTAGDPSSPNTVRTFNLNFFDEQSGEAERGDGEASGIKEVTDPTPGPSPAWEGSSAAWYTLDGRKLDGVGAGSVPARLRKGIYIHGASKVVIK